MNKKGPSGPPLPEAFVYLPTPSTLVSNPMDLKGFSRCRVYIQSATGGHIDVTIKGAPNENGMYTDELSTEARKTGITESVSYVLENTSRYLQVHCAGLTGSWMVWVVPQRSG